MKKQTNLIISSIIGIIIFSIIIWQIGFGNFKEVFQQAHLLYLIPYFIFAIFTMSFLAIKLKFILKTHKQKIPFIKSLKYTVAGFAVSYVTPSARLGGEPLKTYMMHKEQKIPLKIGGSSVVIDKFIELLGAGIMALIGFFLLFLIPGISTKIKIILLSLILFCFLFLFFIYYWTIKGKGPFTSLFNLLRFYKFKRFKKSLKLTKQIEKRMQKFFKKHKKEFFISCLIYGLVILSGLIEFKFLLLALGINASFMEILLAHIVLGITSFIPVPAGLGFQEAGHSGLFALLKRGSGVGLIFSLIVRIRNLIITGIGFIIITNFGKEKIMQKISLIKDIKKIKNNKIK